MANWYPSKAANHCSAKTSHGLSITPIPLQAAFSLNQHHYWLCKYSPPSEHNSLLRPPCWHLFQFIYLESSGNQLLTVCFTQWQRCITLSAKSFDQAVQKRRAVLQHAVHLSWPVVHNVRDYPPLPESQRSRIFWSLIPSGNFCSSNTSKPLTCPACTYFAVVYLFKPKLLFKVKQRGTSMFKDHAQSFHGGIFDCFYCLQVLMSA